MHHHRTFNFSTQSPRGALDGIRVLDLSRVLAGPFATQILGDQGADVIKVEHPTRGDDTRSWGPPFCGDNESTYFFAANRNKRSIGVDLKSEAGRNLVLDLARKSDVVVENFVPGKLDSLGLGYEDMRTVCPDIIYASVNGFGSRGEFASLPGYDILAQAMGGLMSVTGTKEVPCKVGVPVTDVLTGVFLSQAVTAALFHRLRTGQGQRLEASLLGSQLSMLVNLATAALNRPDLADASRFETAHPSIVPYQAIQTQDGQIIVCAANDKQWHALCHCLGDEGASLLTHERFASNQLRVANRIELIGALQTIFQTESTSTWVENLSGQGFPVGPVNSVSEAFASPHAQNLDIVRSLAHPTNPTGQVKVVGHPVSMELTPPVASRAPPLLGQHSREIAAELGIGEEQFEQLRQQGVVR